MNNILKHKFYLTDGGFETELLFKHGFELPEFAAFPLLENPRGCEKVVDYYRSFLDIAADKGAGFIAETPTWRASKKWGRRLGYSESQLERVNTRAVDIIQSVCDEYRDSVADIIISGNIGPQDDGYAPGVMLSEKEAREYHQDQIKTFASAGVDIVSALTLCYADEAIGFVKAANDAGLPSVVAFTLETDGRLPNGTSLASAISEVDSETEGGPAYYMINCAHPSHFENVIGSEVVIERLKAVRGNASRMSHEELDNAEELDQGVPEEFGVETAELLSKHNGIKVFGGCCGTDHRHIRAVAESVS